MNDYSVLSVLFAPTVILLSALLVTGVNRIGAALYLKAQRYWSHFAARSGPCARPA